MAESAPFRLYGRVGCHLCDDMVLSLTELGPGLSPDFRFIFIDVDRRPELAERYGPSVPVLVAPDGAELCEYFLNLSALQARLAGL